MKTILILTFNLFFTILAFGQNGVAAKRVANYNLNNNIAIQGYDPVSYFVDAKATIWRVVRLCNGRKGREGRDKPRNI